MGMRLRLLYFAWVRERIGRSEEEIDPPATLATVADLVDWLAMTRAEGYAEAFADRDRLRAAVDQRFVAMDASIIGAREIAIFPPVTGG
jgi:molybdopterin synthase sulfur carrier subunit